MASLSTYNSSARQRQNSDRPPRHQRPDDPRDFYGYSGSTKFAIYPDFWKKSWGKRPLLGFIWADDTFSAQRMAYSRGLLPLNFTFGPKAVALKPKNEQSS
jgi:hypothetical protein